MMSSLFGLVRPALFRLDPEDAHGLTISTLERGLYPRDTAADDAALAVDLWGLRFPNPVGIAAGFDKDARVPDAVLGMGCGFAEIGTVTPLPQAGNPRPRLFRLAADAAVINRLGFNNGGHAAALARLEARPRRGIVGVNIGANKDAADRTADYVAGIETFYGVASYFTVNISSPNTPGLRDLQAPAQLDELLSRVMAARDRLAHASDARVSPQASLRPDASARRSGASDAHSSSARAGASDAHSSSARPARPVIVKIAPDVAEADLPAICDRLVAHGVDGIAVSNTTLSRPGSLREAAARETGGLSGRPLFHRSTAMLARVYRETGGRVPLIGIGGIDSGAAALAKIEAGATLLQLYSGLVYEGPGLIGRTKRELTAAARREGVASITALTGRRAAEWSAKPLDG